MTILKDGFKIGKLVDVITEVGTSSKSDIKREKELEDSLSSILSLYKGKDIEMVTNALENLGYYVQSGTYYPNDEEIALVCYKDESEIIVWLECPSKGGVSFYFD